MITETELKQLGFTEVCPRSYDEDYYYDWLEFHKNESNLSVTTEFTLDDKLITQIIEINGEALRGEKIGIEDLKTLIKLM